MDDFNERSVKFFIIKENSVETSSNVTHDNLNEKGSVVKVDAISKKHLPIVVVTHNDEIKSKTVLKNT